VFSLHKEVICASAVRWAQIQMEACRAARCQMWCHRLRLAESSQLLCWCWMLKKSHSHVTVLYLQSGILRWVHNQIGLWRQTLPWPNRYLCSSKHTFWACVFDGFHLLLGGKIMWNKYVNGWSSAVHGVFECQVFTGCLLYRATWEAAPQFCYYRRLIMKGSVNLSKIKNNSVWKAAAVRDV